MQSMIIALLVVTDDLITFSLHATSQLPQVIQNKQEMPMPLKSPIDRKEKIKRLSIVGMLEKEKHKTVVVRNLTHCNSLF